MCETLWRPKMTPDEVFECISQALMSSLDRDASSGYWAVLHLTRDLRMAR
jgi:20S proteasome subunit beta 3